MTRLLAVLALTAATISAQALAQPDDTGQADDAVWEYTRVSYMLQSGASIKRYTGDGVFYQPETGHHVFLFCLEKSIELHVSTEPVTREDLVGWMTNRLRTRYAKLIIDGEQVDRSKWVHSPAKKLFRAGEYKPKALIYNAVILDQDVELQISGQDDIHLDLPPVNGAFRRFGKPCGLGFVED